MLTISTKELRNNFPLIVKQLGEGKQFLLIHRSIPIAEIKKPQNLTPFLEATDEDIQKSASKDISEDFLSHKELDYYLSLQ